MFFLRKLERKDTMKLETLGLAAALTFASTFAIAQTGTGSTGGTTSVGGRRRAQPRVHRPRNHDRQFRQ